MNDHSEHVSSQPMITAIVAAYNEEDTIFDVVYLLAHHPLIHLVIVINDGSMDNTRGVLTQCDRFSCVKVINLPENQGKGNAMAVGIENSPDGLLVFVDADMKNLTASHIDSLIRPMLSDRADMVLGYPPFRSRQREFVFRSFKWLTGERALWKRDIQPLVKQFRDAGYGVETIINHAMRKKRIRIFELTGLHHVLKFDRKPFPRWTLDYMGEGLEIAKALLPVYYSELKDSLLKEFHIRQA